MEFISLNISFFATETYYKPNQIDGCIWVLVPSKLNKNEGFGDCIYPVDADTIQDMLLPAFKEKGHNKDLTDKIIACHSVKNDLRMYSQQANFTIHNSFRKLVDTCDSKTLYKIIIPFNRKKYFYDSLRVFGITKSFVYPDLDHISNDLKQAYNI